MSHTRSRVAWAVALSGWLVLLPVVAECVVAQQEPAALTNADIVRLVQAGLGESFIITTIRQVKRREFDLGASALVSLKGAGVSEAILAVMLELQPSRPVAPAPIPSAGAAPAPAKTATPGEIEIDHKVAECVIAGRFPKLEACFAPAADVAAARIHFRAHDTSSWYFVEMKPEGQCYAGVLPKPRRILKKFDYYVEVRDRAMKEKRTPQYQAQVAVDADRCAKAGLPISPFLQSATVVVGAVAGRVTARGIEGFLPQGVVAASGPGATESAAAEAPTAGPSTASGATGTAPARAAGGGIGRLGLVAGGIAVAGGVAALALKKDPLEVDDDKDGFSEKQGDCDDRNAAISPNGRLEFSNARFESTLFNCPRASNNADVKAILFDATNNSCTTSSVSSVSATITIVTAAGTTNFSGQTLTFNNVPFSPTSIASAGGGQTFRATVNMTCSNFNTGATRTGIFNDHSGRVTIQSSAGSFTLTTTNTTRTAFP